MDKRNERIARKMIRSFVSAEKLYSELYGQTEQVSVNSRKLVHILELLLRKVDKNDDNKLDVIKQMIKDEKEKITNLLNTILQELEDTN